MAAAPMWLAFILAEPRTVPAPSTATTVRDGGASIHISRLVGSSMSRG